jgi:hypothetical protein
VLEAQQKNWGGQDIFGLSYPGFFFFPTHLVWMDPLCTSRPLPQNPQEYKNDLIRRRQLGKMLRIEEEV